jgi:hypothetical protein
MKQYYEKISDVSLWKDGDYRIDGYTFRPIPSPGWASLEDRKPTVEDADENGNVLSIDRSDNRKLSYWVDVAQLRHFTHFLPIPKFVPSVPTFGEWYIKQTGPGFGGATTAERVAWMDKMLAEYQSKWGSK